MNVSINDTATSEESTGTATLNILMTVQSSICICTGLSLIALILSHQTLRDRVSHIIAINVQVARIIMCVLCTTNRLTLHFPHKVVDIAIILMCLSLILLTCDRYLSVSRPFFYQSIRIKHAVIIIITLPWFSTVIFMACFLIFKTPVISIVKITSTLLLTTAISLVVSNTRIMLIAKSHSRKIQIQASISMNATTPSVARKQLKVFKSTYVTVIIVFSFIVLWSPVLASQIFFIQNKRCTVFVTIAWQLACLETTLDPVLYIMFNRDIRNEMRRLAIKKFSWTKQQTSSGNGSVRPWCTAEYRRNLGTTKIGDSRLVSPSFAEGVSERTGEVYPVTPELRCKYN